MVRIDRSDDCAVHAAYRLRYERGDDPVHVARLADSILVSPMATPDRDEPEQCCRGRGWLGQIPAPGQLPRGGCPGSGRIVLPHLDVPSALAAMRRETPGVHIEVAGPVAADMVTALRPGRDLWRYDGTRAYPTMGPPSTRAATLLNEVTTPAWAHPVTAYDQALPLGQLTVGELLSLLARPPTPPAQFRSLSNGRWERSAQVFAALGILHCDEPGSVTGGPGAAHRALLVEIAYGIEDWTTEAALFALAVSAWLDPSCRDEVGDAVGQRFLHALAASRYRVVTILHSVAMLVQIVPGIDRRLAVLAREVLDGEDQETRTSLAHGAAGILRTLRLWRNR